MEELNIDNEDPDPDSEEVEVGQYDMALENYKIKANKYREGFVNSPSIGGVHLGKVPLVAKEQVVLDGPNDTHENTPPSVVLEAPRLEMIFHSCQAYLPIFKRMTMKRGIQRLKLLGALPGMITNLLLPQILHKSTKEEKEEINSLIETLLSVHDSISTEINHCEGNSCVRFEFFFSSNLNSEVMSWAIPPLDPIDSFLVSQQNSYFQTYRDMTKEVMQCLKTTVIDHDQTDFDFLAVEAKRMVILCAEMAVTMTEFFPFSGKCMGQVNRIIKHGLPNETPPGQEEVVAMEEDANQGTTSQEDSPMQAVNLDNRMADAESADVEQVNKIMFNVPRKLLVELDQNTKGQTGLRFGLDNIIMKLPVYQEAERLSAEDLQNRHKDYIQIFLNESTNQVKLMNHYTYATGKILACLWKYQASHTPLEHRPSLLELPDFSILALLSDQSKREMMVELCKMVSNVYDFEWWWVIKQKTKTFVSANPTTRAACDVGGAEGFPTTSHELKKYVRGKPQVRIESSRTTSITSIGKYAVGVSTEFWDLFSENSVPVFQRGFCHPDLCRVPSGN